MRLSSGLLPYPPAESNLGVAFGGDAMSREFKIWFVLGFFTLASLCLAQGSVEIKISVRACAGAPADTLQKEEAEARRIFRQAGLHTTWLNCSPKLELEKIAPPTCSFADSTHLVLK